MMLRRLVSWWQGRDSARRPAFRPRLETLEDRRVLSFANDAFVASLYQGLLGRPLESTGQAFWAVPLDLGVARSFATEGIIASAEYQTRQVQDLYQRLLNRNPDPVGQSLFLFALRSGTLEDTRAIMLGTDEFFTRAGGTPGGFLNALFQEVLQRAPSPGEQLLQFPGLEGQFGRRALATQLLASPEADVVAVGGFYRGVLGQEPPPFGLTFWTDFLAAGGTQEAVLASFLASDQYFSLLQTSATQAFGADPNLAAEAFLTRINQQGGSLAGAPPPALNAFSSSVVTTFQLIPAGLPFGPLPFIDTTNPALTNANLTPGFNPLAVTGGFFSTTGSPFAPPPIFFGPPGFGTGP